MGFVSLCQTSSFRRGSLKEGLRLWERGVMGSQIQGSSIACDTSESEDWAEVWPDRWADTCPNTGGGLCPFPVDAEEVEEETDPARLQRSSSFPVASREERWSRGLGTGTGFLVFFWHKENQNIQNTWHFQHARPMPAKRRTTVTMTTPMMKYLLLKNSIRPKGLG